MDAWGRDSKGGVMISIILAIGAFMVTFCFGVMVECLLRISKTEMPAREDEP